MQEEKAVIMAVTVVAYMAKVSVLGVCIPTEIEYKPNK